MFAELLSINFELSRIIVTFSHLSQPAFKTTMSELFLERNVSLMNEEGRLSKKNFFCYLCVLPTYQSSTLAFGPHENIIIWQIIAVCVWNNPIKTDVFLYFLK